MSAQEMLSIVGLLALSTACGSGVTSGDTQLAGGVGDAMASLDETASGAKLSRLELLPIRSLPGALTPGFRRQIMDGLFPKAYAESCWLESFSACANGVETRTFSDCNIGPLTLNGNVALTWSDPSCVLVAAGDSVTRTGDFTVSDYQGGALAITSAGGGQELTFNGTSYSYAVPGMERIATTAGGTKLFDISTSTTTPLGVSGASRAARVVNGGTLVVQHNLLHTNVALTPDNLTWSADCNCPVSGSWNGVLGGSASGSYTLALTGCGTATLTVNGRGENIELDRCGPI
jgi:hypothetical protein